MKPWKPIAIFIGVLLTGFAAIEHFSTKKHTVKEVTPRSAERDFLASLDSSSTETRYKLNGLWDVNTFVDNFGDATNDKYISTNIVGKFSNSATANEILYVKIIMTKSSAGIFLHQYSADKPAQKFIDV